MELVMRLASLGHAARNQAAIKVRQPLTEAAFAVANPAERLLLEQYEDLLADELNVKQVRALGSTGEAISYSLNPLPKQLGQKYKDRMPAVRQAVLNLDPETAAAAFSSSQPVTVEVDGEELTILPEEVEVRVQARSGLAVASEGSYLCALSTQLTTELVREGLVRELIRRVQDLRKQSGFEIVDRIDLYIEASSGLREAVEDNRDYLMGETLTVHLYFTTPPEPAQVKGQTAQVQFEGQEAAIGIVKIKVSD
jgi:isoleucyl-tRNA synthetase